MTSASNQHSSKPLILVVDDSRVVRVSLKNILQRNYDVIEAENGENAWKMLLEKPDIRLVFSDLSMPKLDGIGLLRKVRLSDNEKIRELPFIVITGREENQKIRSQMLDEGANDLVTKPFDPIDIAEYASRHTVQPLPADQIDLQQNAEIFSGITNKVVFSQNARKELSFAIRNKNELALLLLKLDQFETIKKHYSDPAIEHILITTAEIIRSHTRIEDLAAYFGEGTFAILFPAANSVGTKYLGRKILSDLQAKKFYLGDSDAAVTASIGVSAPDIKPGITFGDLLILADQRLQAAVNAGGNRVVDKGNATLTPVSTLLFDDQDKQSDYREIFRQTEISMRRLAEQEVHNDKKKNGYKNNETAGDVDVNKLNDELLLIEHENRLLKEEIIRLRKQNEDVKQLEKQLHETDAQLQQTRLKFQQVKSDYEAMRIRAETAEANQSQFQETENDRSIIEEHLLEESELIHNQLHEANQQIEKSLLAYRASQAELSNLQQELIQQQENFEIELADEHMMRSIAEKKLADLEDKIDGIKKVTNPFVLTATPTIVPIDKKIINGLDSDSRQELVTPKPQSVSVKHSVEKKRSITRINHPNIHKRSWPSKMLVLTICILLSLVGFKLWKGYSIQDTDSQNSNSQIDTTAKLGADNQQTDIINNSTSNTPGRYKLTHSTVETDSLDSLEREEAKLQAELTIRQMAEEEFLLLSYD